MLQRHPCPTNTDCVFLILDLDPSLPWFMVPPDEQKKPKKKRKSKFKPPLKTPNAVASASASSLNQSSVATTSASQSNQAIIPSSTPGSHQNQPSSSSVTGQSSNISMVTPNDVQRGTKRKTRSPLSGKARMPGSLKRKGKVRENLSSILAKIIKPSGNRALKRQTCHSDKGRLSLRP